MDETEYDDGSMTGGLPAFGASGAEGYADEYQRRMAVLDQAAQSEAAARRQAYERAQQQIEQSRFGAPTRSEQLLRISQALMSPRSMPGFAGTMNNVLPVLADSATASRQADEQRAAALMQLQDQYAIGSAEAGTAAATNQLEALGRLSAMYRPQAPRTAYDQQRGRFVTEGAPVRDEAQDMIGPNNTRLEAFVTGDGLVYRTVLGGQQVYVNERGEQVELGGGQ